MAEGQGASSEGAQTLIIIGVEVAPAAPAVPMGIIWLPLYFLFVPWIKRAHALLSNLRHWQGEVRSMPCTVPSGFPIEASFLASVDVVRWSAPAPNVVT